MLGTCLTNWDKSGAQCQRVLMTANFSQILELCSTVTSNLSFDARLFWFLGIHDSI